MFKINWVNIQSALVYGFLSAILGGLFSVLNYIIDAGTIYGLDWKAVLDKGAMASLGIFVTMISIVKNLLTTDKGNFAGVIEVIPNKNEKK